MVSLNVHRRDLVRRLVCFSLIHGLWPSTPTPVTPLPLPVVASLTVHLHPMPIGVMAVFPPLLIAKGMDADESALDKHNLTPISTCVCLCRLSLGAMRPRMRPWVSLADRENSSERGKVLLPARLSPYFNICSRNLTDGAGRVRYFPSHPYGE